MSGAHLKQRVSEIGMVGLGDPMEVIAEVPARNLVGCVDRDNLDSNVILCPQGFNDGLAGNGA
jgi:hypothetical protein